jgi:outer membrane protein assembly factor BamB
MTRPLRASTASPHKLREPPALAGEPPCSRARQRSAAVPRPAAWFPTSTTGDVPDANDRRHDDDRLVRRLPTSLLVIGLPLAVLCVATTDGASATFAGNVSASGVTRQLKTTYAPPSIETAAASWTPNGSQSLHRVTVTRPRRTSGGAARRARTGWPRLRFDNRNTGFNRFENVLSRSTVSGLKARWSRAVGAFTYSAPAVAKGSVYIGASDGRLHALSAATGRSRWATETGPFAAANDPTVANGTVYVQSDLASRNGKVVALSARTGRVLWTAPTPGTGSPGGGTNSPLVANRTVYVGSGDRMFYALDASTGRVRWALRVDCDLFAGASVAKGLVYFASACGKVWAVRPSTGSVVWTATTAGSVDSSPAVSGGGIVYVGSDDHKVYALNAKTGAVVWTKNTGAEVESSAAVAEGVVYIGSWDGNLYALDASTGAVRWTARTDSGTSSPIVANGLVYIASSLHDAIHIFDARNGELIRTITIPNAGSTTQLDVTAAHLYLGDSNGIVHAYSR